LCPIDEIYNYATGVVEPDSEPISDKPVILEPTQNPDTTPINPTSITKVSRKARWLSRVGKAFHSIWLSISAVTLADWLDYGRETLDAVEKFVSDHMVALAVAGALIGAVVVRHVQNLMVEDVREGRYIPSGAASVASEAVGEPESNPSVNQPLGQPA
jgi:hypothetical protein